MPRVLGEYLPRAIDLLADLMRPRLDAHDFDMERNVILEEIARSEDAPTGQAYRKLIQTYFAGQPLGHDVLGTKESIGNLSVEQMREYAGRRYAANNLILSIAGNFEWQQVLDLANEHCAAWGTGEFGANRGAVCTVGLGRQGDRQAAAQSAALPPCVAVVERG